MHKFASATWMVFCILSTLTFFPTINSSASASASSAADVISAVNSLRASHGLPSYQISSILMGTAQGHADFMASTGTITHAGAGGVTVTQRLLAAGYPLAGDLSLGGFRSENIVGSPGMTAEEAVSSWTGDSLHLYTMLSPDLQEIGAGVAEQDGMIYYVIDCARPTGSGLPQDYTPGVEAQLSGADDIIVPVAMSTPNDNGDVYHEVKQGQSLWQIAIAYGVKIKDILLLNHLSPTPVLHPGEKLLVKQVGTATPKPPTAMPIFIPATLTMLPTVEIRTVVTPLTSTPLPALPSSPPTTGATGAVGAIIAVALLAAGFVAWVGRTRVV